MKKFLDEKMTAKGEERAWVSLKRLETLWFNTGTQCNLECSNCYIESSPTNDRLAYLPLEDVLSFIKEIKDEKLPTKELAFTGGEPFLNPQIIPMIKASLATGLDVLVLTNAYRVLKRHQRDLRALKAQFLGEFQVRVSLDHYSKEVHEEQRGKKTFDATLESIKWLVDNGFNVSIAGRSLLQETSVIEKYQELLDLRNIEITLKESENIVIFPEMRPGENVPEITTACWDILGKSADDQMCASQRMIVRRKGSKKATILPCTLIAYDERFELGTTLSTARRDVYLKHAFCSQFCVLGGASCS